MFRPHQPTIAKWARRKPANFAKLLQFVLLTIKVPLHRVQGDIETCKTGQPEEVAGILYGWKHEAYHEAEAMAERTLAFCDGVYFAPGSDQAKAEVMLEYLIGLRGFGLAKAGFVIQLAYGLCGCLDTHNLQRFGLGMNAFKGTKELKTAKGQRKKIALYVATCYKLGGPEGLWDSWCSYVAIKQPNSYESAWHVSATHCSALGLPT